MFKVQVIPYCKCVVSYTWDHLHGLDDQDGCDDLNDGYDCQNRGEWRACAD